MKILPESYTPDKELGHCYHCPNCNAKIIYNENNCQECGIDLQYPVQYSKTSYIFELSNEMYQVIKKHGVQAQFDLLQEECAELIQAISKVRRYGFSSVNHIRNLVEEIGDVKILIDSLVNYMNYQIVVSDSVNSKLLRLRQRLASGDSK